MKKNVIVGQSGGPTAVINASLAGVYKTAKDMGADTIYGMRYGIQGLLEKKIVDLGEKIRNDMDVELLKRTPASFLGSCRYKLPESSEDKAIYEKIFAILEELEITAFFYIGGNDSMDTIKSFPIMPRQLAARSVLSVCPRRSIMTWRVRIIRPVTAALQNILPPLPRNWYVMV